MSGGRGNLVPSWIERALSVIQKVDEFRERWGSRMSRETDDLSKDSIEVIKGLMKYAEREFEREKSVCASEMRKKARVSFHSRPDCEDMIGVHGVSIGRPYCDPYGNGRG